jgi:hypothetical protein
MVRSVQPLVGGLLNFLGKDDSKVGIYRRRFQMKAK